MMGVLACDRKGCDNVMCDRYSPKYEYLCDECFNEFVDSGAVIAEFMMTPKGEYYIEFEENPYDEFQIR